MEGFFTKKEVESKTRPNGKIVSCASCKLYQKCESPRMPAYGEFKKGILIIGESPGEVEDSNGKPWQGKSGKLLKRTLEKFGIDLFEDCLSINAVNCRPTDDKGQNRIPTNFELDCCRAVKVLKELDKRKPKLIILLGASAVYSLIGHRWKKDFGKINKWRGWTIPDQDFKCWICPTFHPSHIEKDETGIIKKIWEDDLESFIKKLNEHLPVPNTPTIITLNDDLTPLTKLSNISRIAFDYETTSLKPQREDHQIICASVATSQDGCYVFMIPESRKDRKPFLDLLRNPLMEKMAHNMKFEDTWTSIKLRCDINNWYWDSMQAAHILDNRPGVTGLKFQTYVNFGIVDYSSEISSYLEPVHAKDGNSENRIKDLLKKSGGKEMLLEYCAMDSIWEYRLAMKQLAIMGMDLPF